MVVGCIDEDKQQGMAVTRARKLAIAERSYALLTEKYGLPARDLIFDALVFPVGTGDENYIGSAVETIEGIRAIKARFPECKTILGISNVSFGLPPAGREVLNAVFLYHCTKAGLDYAIVNSREARALRLHSRGGAAPRRGPDLLARRRPGRRLRRALPRARRRRRRAARRRCRWTSGSARYIVEGSKDGLIEDLDLKLKEAAPLPIINGPLMKGMDEVGRLFNDNQLIVAEVLQSAEAMKAAVGHLERFMEKDESSTRGTIVLATVKGDVHDIGKNLVEIILKNNGYRIINLGIKVPPEDLIAAYHQHKPDAFGLSGLLVKSAQQMVVTAEDLRAAGIDIPLFVGRSGADAQVHRHPHLRRVRRADALRQGRDGRARPRQPALQRHHPRGPARAGCAASRMGCARADAAAPSRARARHRGRGAVDRLADGARARGRPISILHVLRRRAARAYLPLSQPPDAPGQAPGREGLGAAAARRGRSQDRRDQRGHRGARAPVGDQGGSRPMAVYRFFEARSSGDDLILYQEGRGSRALPFPPAARGRPALPRRLRARRCLGGEPDYVAMFAVTCGAGVRERAERWKEEGEYLRSHAIQALAIEMAEALAEMLHARLRTQWGFPDPPGTAMEDRLKAHYRGHPRVVRLSRLSRISPTSACSSTCWIRRRSGSGSPRAS